MHPCTLGLPSFSPCAWTATKTTSKQSFEKTASIMASVVGQFPCCGALFIFSLYFKTGANKLVDFIVELNCRLVNS